MILIDQGKAQRQPVIEFDIVQAVQNILASQESIGQIYELGGSQVYTIKELLEFLGNNLQQRPFYIDFKYDDLMRMYLSPNTNWEKAAHWLLLRPEYLSRQRVDNIVIKKEGIKTFADLGITPLATHHYISDVANFMLQKLAIESIHRRSHEELDADDEGH